jgi:hypothetical protein
MEKVTLLKEEEELDKFGPKSIQIQDELENLFKIKGFYAWSKFDKRVWFLGKDMEKYQIKVDDYIIEPDLNKFVIKQQANFKSKSNTSLPHIANEAMSVIYEILKENNENEVESHDLNKFIITVEKFIPLVTHKILLANFNLQKSQEILTTYNIPHYEKEIEKQFEILGDTDYSHMNDTISETASTTDHDCKSYHTANTKEENWRNKYVSNMEFFLLQNQSKTSDPNLIFKLQINEFIRKDNYSKINRLELKQKNSNAKTKDIEFEEYVLTAFEDKQIEEYFKNYSFSGTTLSTISLVCKKINPATNKVEKEYEGEIMNFLDLLLESLYEITNITNSQLIKVKNLILTNKQLNENISFDFKIKINFHPHTRLHILKRLKHIFKNLEMSKKENEVVLETLLNYFKGVENVDEVIRSILTTSSERRDNCCSNCIII